MAENQRMCVYCESSTNDTNYFYCKSSGNPYPNSPGYKGLGEFLDLCRCADERGWQCQCSKFIAPENSVIHTASEQETLVYVNEQERTANKAANEQPKRRARERLTYLSHMNADGTPKDSAPVNTQVQTTGEQDGKDSSLVGSILKVGAKTAVDMGKTMLNPVGAGVDFAADVVKQMIDEL